MTDGKRVLVVEDSPEEQTIQRRGLKRAGYSAVFTDNYADAMRSLDPIFSGDPAPFDVFITDGDFPREAEGPEELGLGMEFYRQAQGRYPQSRVILVSNRRNLVGMCREQGMEAYEKGGLDYSILLL